MFIYFCFCIVLLTMYLYGNRRIYKVRSALYCKNNIFYINRSARYYFFVFMILASLDCLRYDVGTDYIETSRVYLSTVTRFREPGYMFVNRVMEILGAGSEAQIMLYGFVTIIFVFLFVGESENPVLSLAFFSFYTPFYLQTMNAIRQALAIYVFMYAVKYIKNRNWKKYFACIIFGALFGHVSLMVTLPLYFILNREIRMTAKLMFMAGFCFSPEILIWALRKTPYAFRIATLGSDGNKISLINYAGLMIAILMEILLRKRRDLAVWRNMNLITVTLFVFMMIHNNTIGTLGMDRIIMYFLPSLIILVPSYAEKGNHKRLKYTLILCGLAALFMMSIVLHGEINHLVPYRTIFGK